jgi:phage terminase large subunit
MLPEYSQARKSMWDAVNPHTGKRRVDEAFPLEIRKSTKEQEMMIQFHCGSTFQLVGSDNFNSLVGSPPVGLVFSEYALSNPSAWSYLRPILLENGGWAGFNSTPRGKNHFKGLCELAEKDEDWFYSCLTAQQTGVFTEKQLQAELREMQAEHGDDYGRSLWLQEYFVSFDAAIMGSIFGDKLAHLQNAGRIGHFPYNDKYFVLTAWDLGREDATAIWFFQVIGEDIFVIDHHESNHKDIPYYAELLRQKGRDLGYRYDKHFLPHDARPRTLAAGGKSMLTQFREENVGQFQIAPRLDKQEQIQAARKTLPRCKFNELKCEDGIEALKYYHHVWDDEKKTFGLAPEHDWSSHSADAFMILGLVWKQERQKKQEVGLIEGLTRGSIQNISFGTLKNAFLKKCKSERLRNS